MANLKGLTSNGNEKYTVSQVLKRLVQPGKVMVKTQITQHDVFYVEVIKADVIYQLSHWNPDTVVGMDESDYGEKYPRIILEW